MEKDNNSEQAQMSSALIHLKWMREAMAMAEEALAHSEVPVGCVFVRKNSIIARARNRTNELRNVTIRSSIHIRGSNSCFTGF
jgi:tRNA-specific adenosine deaminase 2